MLSVSRIRSAGSVNGGQSLMLRGEEFGMSGKFLTGAPLNKEWDKIPVSGSA